MDSTETIAESYLRRLGYTDVVYEPDGNVPPDFVVNGTIAVEVRRLSQEVARRTGKEPLDTAAFSLLRLIRDEAIAIGPPKGEHSWFYFVTFRRPLMPARKAKPLVASGFRALQDPEALGRTKLELTELLQLEIIPAGKRFETHFILGGYSDYEAGGWVAAEFMKCMNNALEEKGARIAPFRAKYPDWWLILVDRTGLGFGTSEIDCVRESLIGMDLWRQVTMVDFSGVGYHVKI